MIEPLTSFSPQSEPVAQDKLTWGWLWESLRRGWRLMGTATHNRGVALALLLAILLLGGALRFTGVDWDDHQHLHPDERFLTMVENSLAWPESFKEYLDSAINPLNPYNRGQGSYVYGLLPVVMAKFIGQVIGKTGYDGVYLAGRGMAAALDLLCVWLAFLIGRRLYGPRVGLLAALLLALTALDIQQSHFFTVDTSTTFFVTLALYLAVRVAFPRQGSGGWGSILLMGVAFGLAVSSKISVLSFLLVIGLAFLLRMWGRWQRGEADTDPALWDRRGRLGAYGYTFRIAPDAACPDNRRLNWVLLQLVGVALSLVLVVLVAFVVFRVVQPQAFTGPGFFDLKINTPWKNDMQYISKLMSGEIDYPPSHQWTSRPAITYMLKNMVLWGMGLPLGLAVWLSWAWMAYELYFKRKWAHLLPWAWMTFIFFYQAIQFVKNTRYLLPIYPTMAVIAAYGLITLWDRAHHRQTALRRRWSAWSAVLGRVVVILVVLGTLFWALAFTSIYTRPVSRIAASRWIYENLPPGSAISFEIWDDPLPLNIDGHNASFEYRHIRTDPYWEDIPEKRPELVSWIDQAEYLVFSSNRIWASIPRLPTRFPMTTRYYEALFSGELGFDPLISFTSRPRLFGIEINDDNADESWTVYDHPQVLIFKKRADFDIRTVEAMFAEYDLTRIVRVKPLQVTSAPNNLMLSEEDWAAQRAGGTWSSMFRRDGLANRLPTLVWLLVLFVISLAAFPLAFVAFRRFRDRGYVLSKSLGLLLLGWGSWLLPSLKLLPYSRALIGGMLALLVLIGLAVAWRQRGELGCFVRRRWRLLLVNELLFLGFFGLFWLIRRANPDLWHPVMGGEKPMDLAYLNAIIRSTSFPPYDPWFAGGYLNYYYFGWVIVATVIKLTGIIPTTAYNLAIPTFFAMVAMGASCVAFNLIPADRDEERWFPRALRYGLVGAALVAVLGNLGELQLLLKGFQELGARADFVSKIPGFAPAVKTVVGLGELLFKGQTLPFRSEWWYWNASRIMQNGEINEFPFFTFLYADLHAHLTAMPFALLALGLAASFVVGVVRRIPEGAGRLFSGGRSRPQGIAPVDRDDAPLETTLGRAQAPLERAQPTGRPRLGLWDKAKQAWRAIDWGLALRLFLLALVVGELWCNNSWDYPTYLGIGVVAIAIGVWSERQRLDLASLTALAWRAGALLVLSMLLYRPYHAHFGLGYSSVELWKGERTPLAHYLLIHATFLFIFVGYLINRAFGPGMRNPLARALRCLLGSGSLGRARYLYERLVYCESLPYMLGWLGTLFLVMVCAAFVLAKAWILLLTVPLFVVSAALIFYSKANPEQRFVHMLIALGLVLTLAVEYVVLKGDIGRMNTVFKFYLQVWIIWGVAGAVALARLSRIQERWSSLWQGVWRTLLVFFLASALLYPLFASMGKVRDRWDVNLPPGLDGTAYMTTARYHDNNQELTLEYDRRAIVWLQDHVQGSPVIAEANTPLYRWGSRVSIYTGLPTIIGWDWHQKQQRAAVSGEIIDWRLEDLRNLYNTTDQTLAMTLLTRYQVGYIYVGELEQAYYAPEGLAKFESMVGSALDVAYRDGPVTIYRVRGSGAREVALLPAKSSTLAQVRDWLDRHLIFGSVQAQGPEKAPSSPEINRVAKTPLMLDVPVEELPLAPGREWNRWIDGSTWATVAFWWLVVQVIGLCAWPLVAAIAGGMNDLGYALAKGLGLLLVAYGVWIGASTRLWPNAPGSAWIICAALGLLSLFLWRRQRLRFRTLSLRTILWEEAFFTASFLAFVGLRLLNPDLWQPWFGGEKMMEIAFLNAIDKSAYLPPYDPYFAGGYINYYYYGQYVVALLGKMVGVAPRIGFNLAVPTLFALTVSHAYSAGSELCRLTQRRRRDQVQMAQPATAKQSLWAGLLSVLLVTLIGNLSGVAQLVEQLAQAGGAAFEGGVMSLADVRLAGVGLIQLFRGQATLPAFDYWYDGTRIIPHTINEFPFFSFLFADLHPHMIALPITLLVVALCLTLAGGERGLWPARVVRWGLLALVVGALGPTNTWDLPAYLGLLGGLMLLRGYRREGVRGVALAAAGVLLFGLLAVALYAPFYSHYQAQSLGLAWVDPAERSQLGPFLLIWGLFLFAILSVEVWWLARQDPWARLVRLGRRIGWLKMLRRLWRLRRWGLVLAACGLALWAGGWGLTAYWLANRMAVLALLTPLLATAVLSLLTCRRQGGLLMQRLMVVIALAILLGVELIYLKDFLSGSEWRRMNTLFKFYLQIWVLLGVSLSSVLPAIWARAQRRDSVLAASWQGLGLLLLGASLVYTVMAVPARVDQRMPSAWPKRNTLDGTAYMATGVYAWPSAEERIDLKCDREAIVWLWEHVQGTPVIAEAPIGFYREGGLRVSSYTGLPMLAGAHEREQRPWEAVATQERDAEQIYATEDLGTLLDILSRYRVRYIYVGQLERSIYGDEAMAKFETLAQSGRLECVYRNEHVDIYRVNQGL